MLSDKAPSVVYWLGENLYLNVTNRCTNNCYFCFRKYRDGLNGFNLKLREEPQADRIIAGVQKVINKRRWKEVVFCGFGEPLIRLDMVLEVSCWLKQHYTGGVRVDTNGQAQLIYRGRDVVKELKEAGVDKISVSLNAQGKETYDCVCKPEFEDAFPEVLRFLVRAGDELNTEVTAVAIPEVDFSEMAKLAYDLGVKLRKREYIPCFW